MPQADEGITACQWLHARRGARDLSYDNARGVLKRAGEMARTLVAVGAGRARREDATAQRRTRPCRRRAETIPPPAVAPSRRRCGRRRRARRAGPRCSRSGARCPSGPGVVSCRGPAALRRLLEQPAGGRGGPVPEQRHFCPSWPSSAARLPASRSWPTHRSGRTTASCCSRAGSTPVASVAVEGVDDAVVGDMVARGLASRAERRRALAEAPRMLRLTEPLQQAAWDLLLGAVGAADPHHRPRPAAAGEPGAPLPSVRRRRRAQPQAGDRPDPHRLRRRSCSSNPGYPIPTVVRLLHFASSSHLSGTARGASRTCSTSGLGALGPRGVLAAFVKGTQPKLGCDGGTCARLVPPVILWRSCHLRSGFCDIFTSFRTDFLPLPRHGH